MACVIIRDPPPLLDSPRRRRDMRGKHTQLDIPESSTDVILGASRRGRS